MIQKYPVKSETEKFTFSGVIYTFYDQVAARWHSQTPIRYLAEYYNHILYSMKNVPIEDYTKNMMAEFLEKIRRESANNIYADEKVRHFEWLIKVVYITALKNSVIKKDALGLMLDRLNLKDDEGNYENSDRIAVVKRSFGPYEVVLILNWYNSQKKLEQEAISGEDIGIILMLFAGLRNQEACGLDYKGIEKFLADREEFYCLVLTQVVKSGNDSPTNIMKTVNAFRTIPIMKDLSDFLIRRKEYLIEKIIRENNVDYETAKNMVEGLPVANTRNDFRERCSVDRLSERARELFKQLGIGKMVEDAYEEMSLFNSEYNDYFEEKEPTAYMLRRNFATYIYTLGFSDNESQNIMGHKIDEDYRLKSAYASDPNLLHKLWKRIEAGPYSVYCSNTLHQIDETKISKVPFEQEFIHDVLLRFSDLSDRSKIYLQIASDEPSDEIKVLFNNKVEGNYSIGCITEMKPNVVRLKKHIDALLSASDKCNSDKNSDDT